MKNLLTKQTIKSLDIFKYTFDEVKQKFTKVENEDFNTDNFWHFPLLLNGDNTQWVLANRYLLSKLKEYKTPNPKTLDVIATDLKDFKNFCDTENIDYLKANRKISRPNWLYREYLQIKLVNNQITRNTLKRKIMAVVGFYDWLIKSEGIKFKFPLWIEKTVSIPYKNDIGIQYTKTVTTRDISYVPSSDVTTLYDDTMNDGQRLKPLSQNEQKRIFEALVNINNMEMKLIFSIALFTGARMQTICTLRLFHFNKTPTENEIEVRVLVGDDTYCDTKFSKAHTLFFPKWLFEKIKIYIHSENVINRRKNSKHIFEEEKYHYVFLTSSGKPYYASKNDKYKKLYSNPPSGETIRKFISTTLKKEIAKNNDLFDFTFHDLRASYGMNFVDFYNKLIKEEVATYSQVLSLLRERMGHNNTKTTEQYLNYRKKNKIASKAQGEFEDYLKGLLNEN